MLIARKPKFFAVSLPKKAMNEQEKIPTQCLMYDFTYEGQRHKGKISLDENSPNLYMMYDDHDIEITWVKRIRHKGKHLELSIVVNDDAYSVDEGKVVASAWVCAYKNGKLIESFEPECWSYIDEENKSHNTCKGIFYSENTDDFVCKICDNSKINAAEDNMSKIIIDPIMDEDDMIELAGNRSLA